MAILRKRKARVAAKAGATKRAAEDQVAEKAGDVESGGESSDDNAAARPQADDEDDDFFETPDEKRVRLAKEYLASVDQSGDGRSGIQERLVQDVNDAAKRSRSTCQDLKLGEPRFLKGHKECVTCVTMTQDERTVFTGGKDCAILRWDVETGKKDVFPGGRNCFKSGGHFEQVLDLALVESRNLLLSVGVDRVVRYWDMRCPAKTACTKYLGGHTNTITSIVAEPDGSAFYTGSLDKSMKVWDLNDGRCMDTMFGHVAGVTNMDIYHKGRPASGGTDKTVRLWKVDKETHLVFSKHQYSVDAVAILDHDRLFSGSQDGKIILWSHNSKKPVATASLTGHDQWVTALGAVRGCDTVFSGSSGGKLQTWQAVSKGDSKKPVVSLNEVGTAIDVPGRVNGIAVGEKCIAVAVGKEHRLGGWHCDRASKNGLMIIPLSYNKCAV